jgi:hypothetical protein
VYYRLNNKIKQFHKYLKIALGYYRIKPENKLLALTDTLNEFDQNRSVPLDLINESDSGNDALIIAKYFLALFYDYQKNLFRFEKSLFQFVFPTHLSISIKKYALPESYDAVYIEFPDSCLEKYASFVTEKGKDFLTGLKYEQAHWNILPEGKGWPSTIGFGTVIKSTFNSNYKFILVDLNFKDVSYGYRNRYINHGILNSLFRSAANICRTFSLERLLTRKSTLNALSVIMSRAMSHNFGAHVLSRLVTPKSLNYAELMIDGQYISFLDNPILKTNNLSFLDKCYNIDNLKNEKLSYFFSYLKTRQDLLADIVSSTPQIQTSRWFIKDIMEGLDRNRIMLNKISGVNDFNYRFEFEGIICDCMGKDSNCPKCNGNSKDDIEVSLSNDILGQHALYIIIENIIRNTAKHKPNNNENVFTIRLIESTKDPSYFEIIIYDSTPLELGAKVFYKSKIEDHQIKLPETDIPELIKQNSDYLYELFAFIVDPDLNYIGRDAEFYYYYSLNGNEQVIRQNKYLCRDILDNDLNLSASFIGMKEMKACAAYMNSIPVWNAFLSKHVIDKKDKILVLSAVNPEKLNGKPGFVGRLGYRFFLKKPRKLLIIDFTGKLMDNLAKSINSDYNEQDLDESFFNHLKAFESRGIQILNAFENYKNDKYGSWRYVISNIYPHEILLIISEVLHDDLNVEMSYLPSHSIHVDDFIRCHNAYLIQNGINNKVVSTDSMIDYFSKSPEKLITEVWRAYIYLMYEKKGLSLFGNNRRDFLIKQDECKTIEYSSKFLHHGKGYNDDYNDKFKRGTIHIFDSRFEETVNKLDQRIDLNSQDTLKHFGSDITNVLILDERIQELTYNNTYPFQGGPILNYAHIWDDCNVYIPSPQIKYFFKKNLYDEVSLDLNTKTFDKNYADTIRKIIINRFSTVKSNQKLCKGLDILVIHLGVVEKLMSLLGKDKSNPMIIKEFLDDMITIEANDAYGNPCNNTKIILVSGRGPIAGKLPKEISFLNYSILAQYLVEYRLKNLLTQVLYAARPKI